VNKSYPIRFLADSMERKAALLKRLGKNIKRIREEKGKSQADLAYSIGKEQQSIQRLEAGNINPSYYYLCEIAEGLDVSIFNLLKF
jgi:putative transcriptional regulator